MAQDNALQHLQPNNFVSFPNQNILMCHEGY